jgi:hypothetical protein
MIALQTAIGRVAPKQARPLGPTAAQAPSTLKTLSIYLSKSRSASFGSRVGR